MSAEYMESCCANTPLSFSSVVSDKPNRMLPFMAGIFPFLFEGKQTEENIV